ncbi:MAG TPA: amino acid permease [Candidatus Sulfotelmatobacter sp.]|nr:amino acid permease [Candidatus Sulfotelmatobacter sp.]
MNAGQKLDLVRGLGKWSSAAIVVGTMVGTGIFLKPAEMAADAGSLSIVLAAWIAGGVLSLFGALAFAELGASIPEAGGEYAYLRRAFGPVWGFLFGWMHSIVGRPASMSSIAAGLLRFCAFLLPAIAAPIFTARIPVPLSHKPYVFVFTWAQPGAVTAIGLFAFINFLGVRAGGRVQVVLTATKIAAVVAIIFVGLVLVRPGGAGFHPLLPSGSGTAILTGFFGALAAALWAYDGWEDLNLVGSEVENPQRNIPRALILGVLFCSAIFILFSLATHSALPFSAVAQSRSVASDVVARFSGRGAARWVTLALAISAIGTLNSSILSGARVPYAMARDRIFFRATAGIHARFRTPGGALLFEFALASILALTGTFEELTSLFVFASWIFYAFAVAAMIRLRRTEPELERPYRCWGYPWVPAAFLAGAAALTVTLWLARPVRSSIGLVLILSGLIFYRNWRRKLAVDL